MSENAEFPDELLAGLRLNTYSLIMTHKSMFHVVKNHIIATGLSYDEVEALGKPWKKRERLRLDVFNAYERLQDAEQTAALEAELTSLYPDVYWLKRRMTFATGKDMPRIYFRIEPDGSFPR